MQLKFHILFVFTRGKGQQRRGKFFIGYSSAFRQGDHVAPIPDSAKKERPLEVCTVWDACSSTEWKLQPPHCHSYFRKENEKESQTANFRLIAVIHEYQINQSGRSNSDGRNDSGDSRETMALLTEIVNENAIVSVRVPARQDCGTEETARKGESVSRPDRWESILSADPWARAMPSEEIAIGRDEERRVHTWRTREAFAFVSPRLARENNRNGWCIARIAEVPFADRSGTPYRFRHAVFFRRPASGGFDLLSARDRAWPSSLQRAKIQTNRWSTSRQQISSEVMKTFVIRETLT